MSFLTETTNVVALYPPRKDVEEVSLDEFLDELAEQVRDHCRSTTASIIAIGRALVQAKDRVEHGQFKQWVTSQCGFTIRTAQNYMRRVRTGLTGWRNRFAFESGRALPVVGPYDTAGSHHPGGSSLATRLYSN
jgi:hypothetical protein